MRQQRNTKDHKNILLTNYIPTNYINYNKQIPRSTKPTNTES